MSLIKPHVIDLASQNGGMSILVTNGGYKHCPTTGINSTTGYCHRRTFVPNIGSRPTFRGVRCIHVAIRSTMASKN